MALLGYQRNYASDIVDEAHIEHTIGLVQNQNLQMTEIHDALSLQIQQAPRRHNQHVNAPSETSLLWLLRDTTVDDGIIQIAIGTVGTETLIDLQRKLSRRRNHECPDRAITSLRLMFSCK